MDHPRVALRHHSLRLAGSLVVRLPVSLTLKFLFTSLERRPYHPEIPLKCAALALLSIQPTPSNKVLTSCTPLIIRILCLSSDYLEASGGESNAGLDPLPTPRGIIVSDSVKDLIAIGTMIFCILSLSQRQETETAGESLEELFPKKLLGLLGSPLPELVAEDISRRGLQSDFPSLANDPYLSELSSIAMENSIHQMDEASALKESSSSSPPALSSVPTAPIEKRKTSLPRSSQAAVASSVPKLLLREKTPQGEAKIQIHVSTPDSISSVTGEEVYHPSWSASPDIASQPLTIEHGIDGYSTTLDSPWTKIHGTSLEPRSHTPPIDSNVDRTKLTSIKRVGRKSASRRVRTANDLPSESGQSEQWAEGDTLPATANARLVSVAGAADFGNPSSERESGLPPTPHQPSSHQSSPIIFETNPNEEGKAMTHLPPRKRAPRTKLPLEQNSFVSRSEERSSLHPQPPNQTRERLFSDDQSTASPHSSLPGSRPY
jgi:hypothetical protein